MAAERRLPRHLSYAAVRRAWPALLAAPSTVATLLILGLAVRTFAAGKVVSPWIMIDELTYSDLARSFAGQASFVLRGDRSAVYSVLYPVVISPAWLAHSMSSTYAIAKAINTILVTVAAIPLYVWARRLVSASFALLALLLFLLLPALLYAGTLMTENAALPAFLLTFYALALALERPTLGRQALVLALIALAALIRLQAFVLVPVVVTAVLANAFLDGRAAARPRAGREKLVRFWPTLALLAVAACAYVVVTAARHHTFHGLFGAYGAVASANYSLVDAGRWIVRHYAELGLAVAVLPAAALIVLLVSAVREPRATTVEERAFLAVSAGSLVWFPIQSGVFASHFSHRVEERTMLYVEPLLLLALVIWLARAAPRSRLTDGIAVAVPVVALLALPFGTLLAQAAISDTFGLVPLLALRQSAGMGAVHALVWGGAGLLAVIFVLAPRRLAQVLVPIGVATVLLGTTIVAAGRIADESLAARSAPHVGDTVEWVDHAIGRNRDAAFLYTAAVDPQAVWQTEFWNRSVRRVLRWDAIEPGGLPGTDVSIDERTGTFVPHAELPRLAVVPHNLSLVGQRLGQRGPWDVYRAAAPLRLESSVEGTAQDGWMGRTAVYTVYRAHASAPRAVEIVLSRHEWGGADVPGHVRIDVRSVGATRAAALRTGVLHSSQELRYLVPAPARPFRIRISVTPTFSPADFGLADERQLSAIPSFRLLGG